MEVFTKFLPEQEEEEEEFYKFLPANTADRCHLYLVFVTVT